MILHDEAETFRIFVSRMVAFVGGFVPLVSGIPANVKGELNSKITLASPSETLKSPFSEVFIFSIE